MDRHGSFLTKPPPLLIPCLCGALEDGFIQQPGDAHSCPVVCSNISYMSNEHLKSHSSRAQAARSPWGNAAGSSLRSPAQRCLFSPPPWQQTAPLATSHDGAAAGACGTSTPATRDRLSISHWLDTMESNLKASSSTTTTAPMYAVAPVLEDKLITDAGKAVAPAHPSPAFVVLNLLS